MNKKDFFVKARKRLGGLGILERLQGIDETEKGSGLRGTRRLMDREHQTQERRLSVYRDPMLLECLTKSL